MPLITLAVVRRISDTVSAMPTGQRVYQEQVMRLVDGGRAETIFRHPKIDYLRELIDAIPGGKALVRDDARHLSARLSG